MATPCRTLTPGATYFLRPTPTNTSECCRTAILNLEYGYRYRRKGANLSDINCFRVKEIEMSEKLSFDWFIAKIHEVFDRLPDYRKFSPNLRYSVKEAVLGAFALFFSQSPSFWRISRRCSKRKGEVMPKVYLALSRSPRIIKSAIYSIPLSLGYSIRYFPAPSNTWKKRDI